MLLLTCATVIALIHRDERRANRAIRILRLLLMPMVGVAMILVELLRSGKQ
ncbi:hypothetical protein [Amycolatopsis methanolica]|uniref:hypothetical protein n=1 Tax=Amycolatopsis methanolica TaxID=1814 RepID=UPI003421102F